MIRRIVHKVFGPRAAERFWFWQIGMKSRLLRLRCILMFGHKHEWKELRGGGSGYDALICARCECHIAEYRRSETP